MKLPFNFFKKDLQTGATDDSKPVELKKEDCVELEGQARVDCVDKTEPNAKGHFAPAVNSEEERFKLMFGKGSADGAVNQLDKLK